MVTKIQNIYLAEHNESPYKLDKWNKTIGYCSNIEKHFLTWWNPEAKANYNNKQTHWNKFLSKHYPVTIFNLKISISGTSNPFEQISSKNSDQHEIWTIFSRLNESYAYKHN